MSCLAKDPLKIRSSWPLHLLVQHLPQCPRRPQSEHSLVPVLSSSRMAGARGQKARVEGMEQLYRPVNDT